MAYYSKVSEHKTSGQKRQQAEQRGGFDDEGSNYSGARKPKSGGAPAKRGYARPAGGETRSYARKPADGSTPAKRTYSKPADGSAPAKRTYGRPENGEARPYARKAEDGAPAKRGYGRPDGGESRPYTRKPADGSAPAKRTYNRPTDGAPAKRSYGRPENGETRPYQRKTEDGAPAKRSYGRPENGETRPYQRKTEDGAPAKRSYGRPENGEARPYQRKTEDGAPANRSYSRPAGGESRSYPRRPADGSAPVKRTFKKYSDDASAPRSFGKPAGDGERRFSTGFDQTGRTRGDHITPRPYAEQKREQRFNDFRPTTTFRTQPPAEEDVSENLLSGRNPIREALKSGRDIEKLLVAKGELSGSAKEIVAIAKERHIPVQEVDRVRLDAITQHHQGMLAFASAYQYHSVDEMLALAKSKGELPFLVMLDGVTDPHNLGAVIRTAECAGAHGVIVQERRAVGLTPAAVKASAGAIEHIMVARVVNLTATLDALKKLGVWAYAADPKGEDYLTVDFSGGAVIVVGAEGEGVSRLVLEKCDQTVSLPMRGQIGSLNASVAAGILLYAVLRSR